MRNITIVSPHKSNRLNYVCDWLFKEIMGFDCATVTPSYKNKTTGFVIYYGVECVSGFSIPDAGLLWENGPPRQKEIMIGRWENLPSIFHCEKNGTLPFDLFSAVFYLLSRYEEYLPFSPDKYERFPHTESILFQKGWLLRPLIDEWVYQLTFTLEKHFDYPFNLPNFSFSPTYDIDIAYSYRHKGFVRWLGAFSKDFLKGNFKSLLSRIFVGLGFTPDPFDCFFWLKKTHMRLNLQPTFFILVAQKNSSFDKNILPSTLAMKTLISSLAQQGKIGLHPSFFSGGENIFLGEKSLLENIIGKAISCSRQHYIRIQTPKTYRYLIEHGIKEDFSMGYGSALGFRAGTGRSFYWFDLEKNEQTILRIHPFCFMDSTVHYEEKENVLEAEKLLTELYSVLQKTKSQMITVFHNFSLGTEPEWKGWRDVYFSFLEKMKQ